MTKTVENWMRMRRGWVALLPLIACTPRSEPTPEPPAERLVRAEWSPHAVPMDSLDMGTGLVAPRIRDDSTRSFPYADTLAFRRAPRDDSPITGAMVLTRPQPGGWGYEALLPAGLRPNFMEYGYEESGVPIDSTDATGQWVRGILGFGPAARVLHGWAKRDTTKLVELGWADHLVEHASFFLNDSAAVLHTSLDDARAGRNGATLPGKPYEMTVLERKDAWLRVRLRWPYQFCASTDTAGTHSAEFWTRYLDERGRPRVFYFTRGC